jgi:hypothetical protein
MSGPGTIQLGSPATRAAIYKDLLLDLLFWRDKPSASPRFARRAARCEALAHAAFPEERPATPLPEIDPAELTRDRFLEATDGGRLPVVMRGFARDTAAVRKWSGAYLAEKLGDRECTVMWTDEGGRRAGWDIGHEVRRMPFSAFLGRVGKEQMNITNSAELVNAAPELGEDLELERLYRTFTRPGAAFDELLTTGFFVASNQLGSEVHAAPAGNFFYNVVGRKRWTLFSPKLSVALQPVLVRPFTFSLSALNSTHSRELLGDPLLPLTRLPRYEVELEPGDLLYNAPWWWHEVRNLSPLTIACAVRHVPPIFGPSPTIRNHPVFTAWSVYPWVRTAVLARHFWLQMMGRPSTTRAWMNQVTEQLAQAGLDRERK